MPTHHSLGPDDCYGTKNARAATIEPNEQGSVGPTQMQSAWGTLPEDIELMPQDQDFRFQPPSRLEAVAQHAEEEQGECDHRPQSCSDSAAAVTLVDGVFGSDNPNGEPPAHPLGSQVSGTNSALIPRRYLGKLERQ